MRESSASRWSRRGLLAAGGAATAGLTLGRPGAAGAALMLSPFHIILAGSFIGVVGALVGGRRASGRR